VFKTTYTIQKYIEHHSVCYTQLLLYIEEASSYIVLMNYLAKTLSTALGQ